MSKFKKEMLGLLKEQIMLLSIFGRKCNWYDRGGLLGLPDDADFHILIAYRYTY